MTPYPPRECTECTEVFLPEDPRQAACGGACRVARMRDGRCAGMDTRRVWAREAMAILGITERELRYWLKQYVPPNGERAWGRPSMTFADLYWLAYIARSKESGLGALRASRGIPRVQKLLKSWGQPLAQTSLLEAREAGLLLLTRGRFSIEVPAPVVIVDGPALAYSVLSRHKRRIKSPVKRAPVDAAAERAVPEGHGPQALPGEPEAASALADKE